MGILNGRPCSVDLGVNYVDSKLLTDETSEIIYQVGRWIRENVRKYRGIYNKTSYGLKHVLEGDTKIYLTNNQFKDATLLAGYEPVDPREYNWRFKIILVRDTCKNPNPFMSWAKLLRDTHNPETDFISEMITDLDFPIFGDHHIIISYLNSIDADRMAKVAFQTLWRKYTEESDLTLNGFVEWLRDRINEEDLVGEFANEIVYRWENGDFPSVADYERIHSHFKDWHACDEEIALFERLWEEYNADIERSNK